MCAASCGEVCGDVPVIVRQVGDPLEAELILIASNRQRRKTPSEIMRESEELERIYAAAAKERQGTRTDLNIVAALPQCSPAARETRTRVAEAVGMKPRTHSKVKTVYDAAKSEDAPEPGRAVGRQQMAALDAGETTPHADFRGGGAAAHAGGGDGGWRGWARQPENPCGNVATGGGRRPQNAHPGSRSGRHEDRHIPQRRPRAVAWYSRCAAIGASGG